MTIDRELIEDIESRLGMVSHNIECVRSRLHNTGREVISIDLVLARLDLERAFKDWLTLRTKLQAAGVVSNVGGA